MVSTFIISGYVGTVPAVEMYVGAVKVWPPENDYSRQYMTFDILSSGTIMFQSNNANSSITKEIQYSINNGSWITFNSSGNTGFTVSAGDKVRFKGENARYGTLGASSPRATFRDTTATINVYGNIMSMIYGDNFIGQTTLDSGGYNFIGFFEKIKAVSAENLVLPMETIPDRCFVNFMLDSTTIKYAPKEIPATTIGVLGMQGAFARCPELERASKYSVTNVGASAFTQTYLQDTKLVQAPSVLPIETMGNYACNGMFQGCTSLVNAPELPCSALTSNCYRQMFQDCSSLMYIKCLAVDKSASNCTYRWVRNVNTSGGTFVHSSATTWSTGESAIPTYWVPQPYPPVPPTTGYRLTAKTYSTISSGDKVVFVEPNSKRIITGNNGKTSVVFSDFNGDGVYSSLPSGTEIFTIYKGTPAYNGYLRFSDDMCANVEFSSPSTHPDVQFYRGCSSQYNMHTAYINGENIQTDDNYSNTYLLVNKSGAPWFSTAYQVMGYKPFKVYKVEVIQ